MEMTHRERLNRTFRRLPVDRLPDFEFGAWVQTYDRWASEGMDVASCKGMGRDVYWMDRYFGTDEAEFGPALNINVGMLPLFDELVLEDRGQTEIIQDKDGATAEQLKAQYGASIPRYIRYAIRSRADWDQVKAERLDPEHPERIPQNLDVLVRRFNAAGYPIVARMGSLYGWIRNWMGVENVSVMLYDDFALVEDMMEHITCLSLRVLEKLAGRGLVIDMTHWWEDMCYNAGSLLSPRMFRQMMVPRYQRITDFLKQEFTCEYNLLDSDGNIHQLSKMWLESGINIMFPIESAHTDVFKLAEEQGECGFLRGAFEKRAIISGPKAIDAEFERLMPLIKSRRLIPHTDHLVPPDVPFEHYLYYRKRKCQILGKPWCEPGIQWRPGHIRDWRILGPFDNTGNGGFHFALKPEQEQDLSSPHVGRDGRQVSWQEVHSQYASGYVDLAAALGKQDWALAYAACRFFSPEPRRAWLEIGSDDGVQAWLNGSHVWKHDVYRVAAPGQDLVPVQLREGANDLLLKIGQARGEWGFLCSLSDEDGNPINDLEVILP